ncbi:MAG TPA: hypothetical protein VKU87_06455 [Thermomicrobiaceae bacterium]|nr:hypothetical protein [Thermomicrobiaceae bacterium]
MHCRLGEPRQQPGIMGIEIPIEWSEESDPFVTVHTGSLLVNGFVDKSGALNVNESELDAKLAEMEQMVIASRTPLNLRVNPLAGRIGVVRPGPATVAEQAELAAQAAPAASKTTKKASS